MAFTLNIPSVQPLVLSMALGLPLAWTQPAGAQVGVAWRPSQRLTSRDDFLAMLRDTLGLGDTPFFTGTLRSSRISTRLPRSGSVSRAAPAFTPGRWSCTSTSTWSTATRLPVVVGVISRNGSSFSAKVQCVASTPAFTSLTQRRVTRAPLCCTWGSFSQSTHATGMPVSAAAHVFSAGSVVAWFTLPPPR